MPARYLHVQRQFASKAAKQKSKAVHYSGQNNGALQETVQWFCSKTKQALQVSERQGWRQGRGLQRFIAGSRAPCLHCPPPTESNGEIMALLIREGRRIKDQEKPLCQDTSEKML